MTHSHDQDSPEQSCLGVRSPECMKTTHLPERMKKMPETKASIVLWGRMCPMLLKMNPMNMKKRLTRGNGVAERIISNRGTKGRRQPPLALLVAYPPESSVCQLAPELHPA